MIGAAGGPHQSHPGKKMVISATTRSDSAGSAPPLTVALLALPDSTASTLFGLYDLLLGTRRDWQMLVHQTEVDSPFRPLIVSRDGLPLQGANGVLIQPQTSLEDAPPVDVVVISDLAVSPWQPLGERYDIEAQWMCERYAAGATLASACSGAILLARTGLLAGHEGTSHWGYCEALQREHPDIRWQPHQLACAGAVSHRPFRRRRGGDADGPAQPARLGRHQPAGLCSHDAHRATGRPGNRALPGVGRAALRERGAGRGHGAD